MNAAQRGHVVTLFDASAEIGGQFTIAKQIPGKEEFYETLRYFRRMLAVTGVTLALNTRVDAAMLAAFDEVALATGIVPRVPDIEGIDHPSVLTYLDVLRDKAPVGQRVAIIGCGGIGFDTAMYLSQPGEATSQNIAEFCVEWGIDTSLNAPGGLRPEGPVLPKSPRQIGDAATPRRETGRRAWQNDRVDPSRDAAGARREDDPGGELSAYRRSWFACVDQRRTAGAGSR